MPTHKRINPSKPSSLTRLLYLPVYAGPVVAAAAYILLRYIRPIYSQAADLGVDLDQAQQAGAHLATQVALVIVSIWLCCIIAIFFVHLKRRSIRRAELDASLAGSGDGAGVADRKGWADRTTSDSAALSGVVSLSELSETVRLCPKCHSQMRFASDPDDVSEERGFWRCSRYPRCEGAVRPRVNPQD